MLMHDERERLENGRKGREGEGGGGRSERIEMVMFECVMDQKTDITTTKKAAAAARHIVNRERERD